MVDLSKSLAVTWKSDTGLKRQTNEDACDYRIPAARSADARLGALFVVADGVGSLGSGEQASHTAIETVLDTYYDPELDDDDPRERLIAAVQDANEAVRARSRAIEAPHIGTTLAGAVIFESGQTWIFHVGDSRVYHLRGASIQQLTADHSFVDSSGGRNRSKLTAYIGQPAPVLPGMSEQTLEAGDVLLICSDGLWGLVNDKDIAVIIRDNPLDGSVEQLVERVYANGARDNVTVMLVQYQKRKQGRSYAVVLMILALMAALAIAVAASGVFAAAPPETTPPPQEETPRLEVLPEMTEDASGQLVVRTATAPS